MPDATAMYQTLDAVLATQAIPDNLPGILRGPGWNQRKWVDMTCGTAFCYAGWAMYLHGWRAVPFNDPNVPAYLSEGLEKDGRVLRYMEIGAAARDLLGLTTDEADTLFDEENDLDTLKELVDSIVAGTFEPADYAEPWLEEVAF